MKNLLIILKILLCLTFFNCGIPSVTDTQDDLNPPLALKSISRDSNGIKIEFSAYNKENSFSGYNVYMSSVNDVSSKPAAHLSTTEHKLNTDIEKNYIVMNIETLDYPTLPYSFSGIETAQTIQYLIIKAPNNTELNTYVSYYILVTAYDKPGVVESPPSNYIEVKP